MAAAVGRVRAGLEAECDALAARCAAVLLVLSDVRKRTNGICAVSLRLQTVRQTGRQPHALLAKLVLTNNSLGCRLQEAEARVAEAQQEADQAGTAAAEAAERADAAAVRAEDAEQRVLASETTAKRAQTGEQAAQQAASQARQALEAADRWVAV